MNPLKHFYTSLLLTSLSLGGNLNAVTEKSVLQQAGPDFITVAKKSIPSVVSVQVKGKSSKSSFSSGQNYSSDDFSNFFNDDFLQRFFSYPRRYKEEQRAPSFEGQASGFIVSSDGYVLTNSHVVQDATEIKVILQDRREFTGKLIGHDPNTDIGLIKIDAKDLPYMPLGNSSELQTGQWVAAIGNPFGLQASLTVGVVSATGRNNLELSNIEDFIQTDAAINQGNSGGPLINLSSEVIGITNAIVTNGHGGGYIGIGFAIPSNIAKHVMDQLISTGVVTRGFIGVSLQSVDQELAQAFGLSQPNGALVTDVAKDSPADKANIKRGDIIQAYNAQSIGNIASLRNAISLMEPGTKITLSILRKGKTIEVPVEIASYPSSKTNVARHAENKLGFDVQELTPDLAQSLGIKEEKGVVISRVDAGSSAALAGLKKGALIIAVNQQAVTSVDKFNEVLQETPSNKPLLLLVRQGDAVRFISLRVGE